MPHDLKLGTPPSARRDVSAASSTTDRLDRSGSEFGAEFGAEVGAEVCAEIRAEIRAGLAGNLPGNLPDNFPCNRPGGLSTDVDQRDLRPLGRTSYGSIGHIVGSKLGFRDKFLNEGLTKILTVTCRNQPNKRDRIFVAEKLDGTCVSVYRRGDEIFAVGRAGYLACSSPHPFVRAFAHWVDERRDQFMTLLNDGERVVGEWLLAAHGIRYEVPADPFYAFDIIALNDRPNGALNRVSYPIARQRLADAGLAMPRLLHDGGALPPALAMSIVDTDRSPTCPTPDTRAEGVVYRCETNGFAHIMGKFVRGDFEAGILLPGISTSTQFIWNRGPVIERLVRDYRVSQVPET